jgi:hypothetical protein
MTRAERAVDGQRAASGIDIRGAIGLDWGRMACEAKHILLCSLVGLCIAGCGGGGTTPLTQSTAPTAPTVTVTPASSSIATAQSLSVSVAVAGAGGTPTGSVVLTSGSYTSAAATLSSGGASIAIPAGSLATGSDTLSVAYTPDSASSSIYKSASGTASVTVTAPSLAVPTVTVIPSSSSITATQSLPVAVTVAGAGGTPTGSVVLSSGSYTSAAATLSSGNASITIPAGSLATGNDTLSVAYTPDSASSSIYKSASGTASVTVSAVTTTYVLTVNSASPSSGIPITVSPADNNGAANGTTSFTRSYNSGTQVTLSAPLAFGAYSFVSWTGCASNPSASICDVTMSAAAAVTATYNGQGISSITVTPNTATIGTQVQFAAAVHGTGSFSSSVSWAVAGPAGSTLSPGDISSTGLYTTPYPAPATVTVTATSTQDPTKSGSVTVTLSQPATATGPSLTVDTGKQTRTISPLIYGINGYLLDAATVQSAHPSIVRWGGDDISRYNYQTNTTNSASDYYFENFSGAGSMFGGGAFTGLVTSDADAGAETLGTVPVLGWVANSTQGACSFSTAAFPGQTSSNGNCGSGIYAQGSDGCTSASGCDIFGNPTLAAITSQSEPPPDITASSTPAPGSVTNAWATGTWSGGWVNSILNAYGPANPATGAGKGAAIWDLDNEPTWWDAVHRDVHPDPFTYDEVTNGGIGTALAIKTADPTALVSGPVIDNWWAYFYSKKDIEAGWAAPSTVTCAGQPWSEPTDRQAHGGVPMIEYYLQQFNKYSQTYGIRLLDYVDIHAYFAPTGAGLASAGDTALQQSRLNGTRVFWDSTYTDPNYPQPNYPTDPGYTTAGCSPPLQAPNLINTLKSWVSAYPGTKIAIDEYNFGGLESINGAVTQADILGIFGREGLDLGALWPTGTNQQVDSAAQGPGNFAFAMYRNYDGSNSAFGDTALASTSTTTASADGEGQLAVYGAVRSSDGAITIMVVNKTYGDLTSTLSLENFTATSSTAQAYLYSNANLNAIVAQPAAPVTLPAAGSTASTITTTFPAQSITLLVVPN